MPYFFQQKNSRKFLVANYLRYNFDTNALENNKPIYSFIPSNSNKIENFSANTKFPVLEYDHTSSRYILSFDAFNSLYKINSINTASIVYVSKNRALSSASIANVVANLQVPVDTYGLSGDKVFTFLPSVSADLNYLNTGQNKIIRCEITGLQYDIDILLRSNITGAITAKTDVIGFSFNDTAGAYIKLNTITLSSDIWGYSYNTYTMDISAQKQNFLFFDSVTNYYNNSGFFAPSILPFKTERYDISNGYPSLSSAAKRHKQYITSYDHTTKTYTLSDTFPYNPSNNYNNTFFYPGLSTRVYHNNRIKDVFISYVTSGSFTFITANDAWGESYSVPTSAASRNYVLDKKIQFTDDTAGTWKLFDTPFVNNLNLSGMLLTLGGSGVMPVREQGILSSFSVPFNILIDETVFKYRYVTSASSGKPQRWINSQAIAFKEYNNLICPLSSFYTTTQHNIPVSVHVSYASINKDFCKKIVYSVNSVSSFNVVDNFYDINNSLINSSELLPLTASPITGYPTEVGTHSYELLSSVSFVYLSGSGVVSPEVNGIYRVNNEYAGGYPAYINNKGMTITFDVTEDKWLINRDGLVYYGSDTGINKPWQTTSWELCAHGIAPAPVSTRVYSNYGVKTAVTKNYVYVLDSNRLQIHAYSVAPSGTYHVYNIPNEMGIEYCDYMSVEDMIAVPTYDASDADYIGLIVKYEKHSDIGNYFYGVKILNTAKTEGIIKRWDIDSSLFEHVSGSSFIQDVKITTGTNQANGKQTSAYLYVTRPNNTYFSGCTGLIDMFNINIRTYLGFRNLNNSLFLTNNPTLSNYRFGAAIAASRDMIAYTLSSNENSFNTVEYASVSAEFLTQTVPPVTGLVITPEKYFTNSTANYGKQLQISSMLQQNAYQKLLQSRIIDTDRLIIADQDNINVYEKIFTEFHPTTSFNLSNINVFLDDQTIVVYKTNELLFRTLSAFTNKYY